MYITVDDYVPIVRHENVQITDWYYARTAVAASFSVKRKKRRNKKKQVTNGSASIFRSIIVTNIQKANEKQEHSHKTSRADTKQEQRRQNANCATCVQKRSVSTWYYCCDNH